MADQNRHPPEAQSPTADLGFGLLLIAVAGCVDAIGFLRLGGTFVSFMSGNSTKMAIDAVHGDGTKALAILSVVASFTAGAFFGRLLRKRTRRYGAAWVLIAVALLLALPAAFAGGAVLAPVLLALAMGFLNTTVNKLGPVRASLTYVTGSLVHLGERIADAVLGKKQTWAPYAMMWCSMVAGACAGAALYGRFELRALYVPAAFTVSLAIISAITSVTSD